MKLFGKIALALNIILVFITLGSYLSPGIDPDKVWFFSVLGLLYPILLILNVVFVVFWFLKDIKYSLISISILLIGYIHFREFWAISSPKKYDPTNSISVVSYNISNAIGAYDKDIDKKKKLRKEMSHFLSRFQDEDIICMQEVGTYASEVLNKAIPNKNVHKLDKGAIIMSKHQIIKKGEIDFGTITNSCLWADLKIGLDTIRVYSIHLMSNSITLDADKVLDEPQLDTDKTWLGIKGIFSKYVKNHIIRSKQAVLVKSHIDKSPHPTIICGDFNDTPLTYTYRKLSAGLVDNFTKAGNGLGTTFNGRIPLLRIDYILSDTSFEVQNFNVIKENFSDHYPVASILSVGKY